MGDGAGKGHFGNEHFAILPEELVKKITSLQQKRATVCWIHLPGGGEGGGVGVRTTGIAALSLGCRFTGIDIYADNVAKATKNIRCAASLITGHAPRTV